MFRANYRRHEHALVILNQAFEYFDRAEINKNVIPLWISKQNSL